MSKGSSYSSRGSYGTKGSNSAMWGRPASGKHISALKSHSNYDGKYYSAGRAGETIGKSVRKEKS